MIPTIDLGSIAVLGTLITIIKHIWSAIANASTWLFHQFVIFLSSSKIWATAFFLSIVVFIVGRIATVVSQALGQVANAAFQRLIYDEDFSFEFGVVNEIWDWGSFIGLATYCLTFTASIFAITRQIAFVKSLIDKFLLYVRSFKL